jgi:hypothetical protein
MSVYLPTPLVYLFVGGALCIPAVVVWTGFMDIFKGEAAKGGGEYNPLTSALYSIILTAVTFGFFYWVGKLVLQRLF